MASATKQTTKIREHKIKRQGQKRKGKLRQEGSTKTKAQLFGDAE